MSKILDGKSLTQLLTSLEAEAAKSTAELRSGISDMEKALSRQGFILQLIHYMKQRYTADKENK